MKIKSILSMNQLITIILLLIGLSIFLIVDFNFYYLFTVIFISIVVSKLLGLLLSPKDQKKRKVARNKKIRPKEINPSLIISCNNVKPMEQLFTYDLKDLSELDFQELCFQYFKNTYRKVEQIPTEMNKNVNFIIVNREGFRVAVQVKHKVESGENVTSDEIQAFIEGKRIHNCKYAMVISTTDYIQDARDIAAEHEIEIYTYRWIENKVLHWRNRITKQINDQ